MYSHFDHFELSMRKFWLIQGQLRSNLRLFVDAFFIISDISTFLVFKFILTETSSDWTQKKIREHLIGRSVIQWKLIPVKGVSMIFEFKKSNCSSSFLSGTFFRLCLRKLELLCGGLVFVDKITLVCTVCTKYCVHEFLSREESERSIESGRSEYERSESRP